MRVVVVVDGKGQRCDAGDLEVRLLFLPRFEAKIACIHATHQFLYTFIFHLLGEETYWVMNKL